MTQPGVKKALSLVGSLRIWSQTGDDWWQRYSLLLLIYLPPLNVLRLFIYVFHICIIQLSGLCFLGTLLIRKFYLKKNCLGFFSLHATSFFVLRLLQNDEACKDMSSKKIQDPLITLPRKRDTLTFSPLERILLYFYTYKLVRLDTDWLHDLYYNIIKR